MDLELWPPGAGTLAQVAGRRTAKRDKNDGGGVCSNPKNPANMKVFLDFCPPGCLRKKHECGILTRMLVFLDNPARFLVQWWRLIWTRRDENKTISIVNVNPPDWQHGLSAVGFCANNVDISNNKLLKNVLSVKLRLTSTHILDFSSRPN